MKLVLGILQADDVLGNLVEDHGEYPLMFERLLRAANSNPQLQLEFVTYKVNKGIYPADIDEVDAYIMTGSKSSVYEQTPWVLELGKFVRSLHQRQKKFIGICFGHQMVAQALGGETRPAENGWSLGTKQTTPQRNAKPEAQPDLLAGKSFKLIYSHQDQVVVPAPGTEILASTRQLPYRRYPSGQAYFDLSGPSGILSPTTAAHSTSCDARPIRSETYAGGHGLPRPGCADQDWVARLMIDFCLGPSVGLVTVNHYSLQAAVCWKVVVDWLVLGAAVVPDRDAVCLPGKAAGKLCGGVVLVQEGSRIALLSAAGQPSNMGGEQTGLQRSLFCRSPDGF